MNTSQRSHEAVVHYFDSLGRYLTDPTPKALPDSSGIVAAALPTSSLLSPRVGHDEFGPFVEAYFDPVAGRPAPTKPYRFDPWWFAIMVWLELFGHGFRLNTVVSSGKLFYFLAYRGAENLAVRRIIMNPAKRRAVADSGDYHEYRASQLRVMSDRTLVEITDYDMNTPYRARDALIEFIENLAPTIGLTNEVTSSELLVARLKEWFTIADDMSRHTDALR